MNPSFDLIIIGGGTAALAAGMEALDLEVKRIALLEKRQDLGGECALNACVPTKTLLTAATLIKTLKSLAPQYGLTNIHYNFDFKQLMKKEETVIHTGGNGFLEDPRITVLHGEASFASPYEVQVNGQKIRGQKIIIATGATPRIPNDIEGIQDTGFMTFQQATHLQQLPKSLIIIGGGPVGVEFAYLFGVLGSKVTLLEREERLLKHEEPEISNAIQTSLEREGIDIHLNCEFQQAERDGNQKMLKLKHEGKTKVVQADEIMVSIGMTPRIEALNLKVAGIQATLQGITVNDELQTNLNHIWAVGDVIGHYEFTHTADYEAVIATRNAMQEAHQKINYNGIGWSIHTHPIAAHVQYTEAEAREKYGKVVVLKKPVESVSRYRIESETEGFIKMIIEPQTNQVVGGHIYANHADDMAHLLMLAIRQKMTVAQLLDLIYIYPSRTQLIQKALETYPAEKAKTQPSRTSAYAKH